MKTVLVNCQMLSVLGFDCFGTDNYQANWIHHGLGLLSASAKRAGFEIDLIDLRKCKSWEDFESRIANAQPDVVGLSMTSLDYNPVMRCIDIIKRLDRNITTVVGGIHPTVALEEVAPNPGIDYIVQGEGEISFPKLLGKIKAGERSERVMVGEKPDLDQLPFVDREIFDYSGELSHPFRELDIFVPPFVSLLVGRGCLYNCKFCQPAERLLFGRTRLRSVDNVFRELKELREKYKFKCLMIYDDCFIEHNHEWVLEFCDRYESEGFDQPFYAQCRSDIICRNEPLIKRLSEVGLACLSIGFESGNQRVLNFLGKGIRVEQSLKAAEICRKYDIKISGNFMLGIPTETKKEALDTIKLIKAIRPYSIGVAHYTPYPGSALHTYCKEHNLIKITSHDDYHRGRRSSEKIRGVDYGFLRHIENDLFQVPYFQRFVTLPTVERLKTLPGISALLQWLSQFGTYRSLRAQLHRL